MGARPATLGWPGKSNVKNAGTHLKRPITPLAMNTSAVPSGPTTRAPGCGTLRKNEFEQFIFTAMGEKFREFKLLRGGEGKVNPKITAYQVELAQVEAEIEKLLDTLTGANATLLVYANKKIEDLDNRRKTLSKAIADLSIETLSSQQIELLSGYLDDWEHISFEDKRKAADSLISSISATSNYVKIEWKI